MRTKFKESMICGILVLLVISSLFFVESITSASESVGFSEKGILEEEWRYDLSWYSWGWFGSSPAILDLGSEVNKKGNEPNSDLEIITGSDEYCRYYPELGKNACGIWRVFDSKRNIEWATDTLTDESRSSPSVVDLDGDGDLEIIGGTTSGYYLQVLNHLGKFVWTFPKMPAYYTSGPFLWPSSPAVADINKEIDGLEVVIGNRVDGKVYAFDGANNNGKDDGITITSLAWFPYPLGTEGIDWDVLWTFEPPKVDGIGPNGIVSTPAIADVDKDGELEVVVGSTNGYVYVLNASDGELKCKFKTGGPVYSSPAIANIDKDKYLEIIIGSMDKNVYSFQCIGKQGNEKWKFPTNGPIYSSPAIDDIDEDGEFEIVIGSNDWNVYALSASGSKKWEYLTSGAVYSSPAIANRGKDFGFDIYIGSDDGYLYLLDGKTGAKIDRFQVYRSWFGGIHTSPSVADIDGDNKLEIVFYDWGQGSAYEGHTFWVIEDTQSQVDKYSIQWGMFRGNPSRTGSFRIRPFNAVELAKEVIDAPYLGDGRIWGGKGYDCRLLKFISPEDIKMDYYYYDGRIKRCSKEPGRGLDCSGLSFWSYNRAYLKNEIITWRKCVINKECPIIYEGAARQYKDNIDSIKKEELRPGDLLFLDTNKNGFMDHVILYIGEGEVIHAEGVIFKKIVKEKLEIVLYRYREYPMGFGRVIEPRVDLRFIATSPVDLFVIDPDGFEVSLANPWDGPMEYQVYDINEDGELDDILVTGERKIGDYLIKVVPEHDALPTDTYTFEVEALVNGETITMVLAENVPISDIPRRPYIARLTETEIIPVIPAFVDFDPDTLNLKSKGKWVTVYLELPVGYNINEIDLESIKLNGQIPAEPKPTKIGDYDKNGIPDLMVKFNRSAVQSILEVGDKVKITISGKLIDGRPFEGSDIIRVISPEKVK